MFRSILPLGFFCKLALSATAVAAATLALAGLVPDGKPAHYPDWWFERDVIVRLDPNDNNTPVWPNDYPAADDYAAANLGQLKHIAAKAALAFDETLPGGRGPAITAMISGWAGSSPSPDDYAAANIGQLKAVASKFYERLDELNFSGPPVLDGRTYPWMFSANPIDNYALLNLGQLKWAFSFDPFLYTLPVTPMLAAGYEHTLALRADGSVWSWGYNVYGQLGHGVSGGQYHYPVKISALSGMSKVSAGANHSLALKADGTVWTWGYNGYGQLGDGSTTQRSAPVQINLGAGVQAKAVAGGQHHSLALKTDGTVLAWGYNGNGWLGVGHNQSQITPAPVLNLTQVQAIAAGDSYSVALKTDGTVWAWGIGVGLGNGNSSSASPVQVPVGAGNVAISSSLDHVMVLKADGSIWAWGSNSYGKIGNGTTSSANNPMRVSTTAGESFVAIAAGHNQSAALRADGALFTWGGNTQGQLGQGTSDALNHPTPARVGTLLGLSTVASGGYYTVIAYPQGDLLGFGSNNRGQLGQGTTIAQSTPGLVQGLSFANPLSLPVLTPDGGAYLNAPTVTVASGDAGVTLRYTMDGSEPTTSSPTIASGQTLAAPSGYLKVKAFKADRLPSPTKTAIYRLGDQVAAGYEHTLALRADGSVWSWGYNYHGQLGDGSTTQRTIPVRVSGHSDMIAIAAGYQHSLAVKQNGTVWAWGDNSYGQLGDGSTTQRSIPVLVSGLDNVVAVSVGDGRSFALKSDGSLWAWGNNGSCLGDGTSIDRSTPLQIMGGEPRVISVSAGQSHAMALRADGSVWTWGSGNLGLADGTSSSVPVPCGNLPGFAVAISAGQDHSMALMADGKIWAWGDNSYHQLADGTTTTRYLPTPTTLTGNFVGISAGYQVSAALRSDGTVMAWGRNNYGQLGQGDTTAITMPQQVPGLVDVFHLTASHHLVTAGTYGGLVGFHAWGWNNYGQLGDASTTDRYSPVTVAFDSDMDGLPDLQELVLGTLPFDGDSDDDGMLDGVEVGYGLNPLDPADGGDTADPDGDLLPNLWELNYQFNPNSAADALLDADSDGLTNLQEYTAGTNPRQKLDSDGDTLSNDWETVYGLNPNSGTDGTITADSDQDGVTNRMEYLLGFNPTDADGDSDDDDILDRLEDRDADGLPDLWEQTYFNSPTSAVPTEHSDTDTLTNAQEYVAGTNPKNPDTDYDTLPDGWELADGLDPLSNTDGTATADSDQDGVTNRMEYLLGFDPTDADGDSDDDGILDRLEDRDADGLPDLWEQAYFNSPTSAVSTDHSDTDTLTNAQEYVAGTNPKNSDTDYDTLPDGWELANSLDPLSNTDGTATADSDQDGVTNRMEYLLGFDPTDADGDSDDDGILDRLEDRDGDGLTDLWEQRFFNSPTGADGNSDSDDDGLPDPWEQAYFGSSTSPQDSSTDYDKDGLFDGEEFALGADPTDFDSDDDLLTDGFESQYGLNILVPTDSNADGDQDGLTDLQEQIYDTNPDNDDSDGDGVKDGIEAEQGSDPNDPTDSEPQVTVPLKLIVGDHSESRSERYNLVVRPVDGGMGPTIRHQATQFGVVAEQTYNIRAGQKYEITVTHVDSSLSEPDYDYTARIEKSGETQRHFVIDDEGILGNHDESLAFFAEGKTAKLYVPRVMGADAIVSSGQFATNHCYYYVGGTNRGQTILLVGGREDLNTGIVRVAVTFLPNEDLVRDRIRFGLRRSTDQQMLNSQSLWAGSRVSISTNISAGVASIPAPAGENDDVASHEVICWLDLDQDGQYESVSEARYAIMSPDVKFVTRYMYADALAYANTLISVGNAAGLVLAPSFIEQFITDVSSQETVLAADDSRLSQRNGLNMSSSDCSANVPLVIFPSSHQFAEMVADSPSIIGKLRESVTGMKQEIEGYFTQNPSVMSKDYELQLTGVGVGFSVLSGELDLKAGIGEARISGILKFTITRNSAPVPGVVLNIRNFHFNGHIEDVYDWNYYTVGWLSDRTMSLLQAGYPTLGDAGAVWISRISIDQLLELSNDIL